MRHLAWPALALSFKVFLILRDLSEKTFQGKSVEDLLLLVVDSQPSLKDTQAPLQLELFRALF